MKSRLCTTLVGIDVQVGRLRRKIESDPARPRLIKSVRGAGYLFTAPVRKT